LIGKEEEEEEDALKIINMGFTWFDLTFKFKW
jgi:hypothetical protein